MFVALMLMAAAAFLEGLGGQGSNIDAIFEIEAQVVDDVLNEHTRSISTGDIASKPQSPSRSGSPPRKSANKETLQLHTLPESPPAHAPNVVSSPGQLTEFPSSGSFDGSSPLRGRRISEAHSDDSHGAFELFRQDSQQSSQNKLPVILRTPPRPQLPPRHVRTRRNSQAVQLHRMAALSGNQASQSTANPDPFALNPPMTGPLVTETGVGPSPLGQLYGTVVVEDDEESTLGSGALSRRLSFSQAKRLRAMSTGANSSNKDLSALRHRRRSSNPSTRPGMLDVPTEELPETVQETEDDAERAPESSAQLNKRDEEVLRLLQQLQNRQGRIESQIKELLDMLQHQR
jgi:hypothetical protein